MAASCVLPSSHLFIIHLPHDTCNCKTACVICDIAVRFNAPYSGLEGPCFSERR